MPDTEKILGNIRKILTPGKGILAADESSGTIKKRFDSIGVESTEENRRSYRNMLFSTPGCEQFISGVILFDETVDQKDDAGMLFPEFIAGRGMVAGIKNDEGKEEHPHWSPQTVTRGLKGLGRRLENWTGRSNGALGFTKWRQVILVDPEPSDSFLDYSMSIMAEQAAWAISAGYVPICEPEVLMEGNHTREQCAETSKRTLTMLYKKLEEQGVDPAMTILKTNMVLSGKGIATDPPQDVAEATINVFCGSLPDTLPGVVFLSGGQTSVQATANLNACSARAASESSPWTISFSYGRALQEDALKAWGGNNANFPSGQSAFLHRAKMNSLAQKGEYSSASERTA